MHPAAAAATGGVIAAVVAAESALAKIDSPQLDSAARRFAAASYPLMQKIDWIKTPEATKFLEAGSWTPEQLNRAIDTVLEAGADMDPEMIKRAVEAHQTALAHNIEAQTFIASPADVEEITSSLARLITSTSEDKVMAIYKAFNDLGGISLDREFMEGLGGAGEVAAAYKAFIDLIQIAQVQMKA